MKKLHETPCLHTLMILVLCCKHKPFMRVILTILILSSFVNLYGQTIEEYRISPLDSFTIHIGDYENFSVLKNGEELDLMHGEMDDDNFGSIETKTVNYFPIMITTHKLGKADSKDFFESTKKQFRDKFSKVGCIDETENKLGSKDDVIILKANEKLPFMYIVYSGYLFDDMLVDLLKLDIKNEVELKEYLLVIENIEFLE